MQYDDGDWKELRGRVDSVANAVFPISGGALTLSIAVFLRLKETTINLQPYADDAACSWFMLLGYIVSFVVVKMVLIAQAFSLKIMKPEKNSSTVIYSNIGGWLIGVLGLFIFVLACTC
ncbi:hypothetical protein [Halomonas litopenaei]|uniref:hypothetical protein n=1 Tax=Halomonas litopenaei TaxID=2109328 RepID=UPI001A8C5227|nr:hypothetical protein [Halomonas litopenaei]MBN8413596.1 hypothetical protein [Halomonas litopenaei]